MTGVADARLAHHPGQFGAWQDIDVPADFDVEDFAAAFVRFDNGATLVLGGSWFLHHNIQGEDMQMWLYGTEGGCHWPKAEFLHTNYATRQFTNCATAAPRIPWAPRAGVRGIARRWPQVNRHPCRRSSRSRCWPSSTASTAARKRGEVAVDATV
ncbi:MAG: hypothetical protein R3A10_12825 [Caldilineaceae bacterium]